MLTIKIVVRVCCSWDANIFTKRNNFRFSENKIAKAKMFQNYRAFGENEISMGNEEILDIVWTNRF